MLFPIITELFRDILNSSCFILLLLLYFSNHYFTNHAFLDTIAFSWGGKKSKQFFSLDKTFISVFFPCTKVRSEASPSSPLISFRQLMSENWWWIWTFPTTERESLKRRLMDAMNVDISMVGVTEHKVVGQIWWDGGKCWAQEGGAIRRRSTRMMFKGVHDCKTEAEELFIDWRQFGEVITLHSWCRVCVCVCVSHLLLFLTTAAQVQDSVLCEEFAAWHGSLWTQCFLPVP